MVEKITDRIHLPYIHFPPYAQVLEQLPRYRASYEQVLLVFFSTVTQWAQNEEANHSSFNKTADSSRRRDARRRERSDQRRRRRRRHSAVDGQPATITPASRHGERLMIPRPRNMWLSFVFIVSLQLQLHLMHSESIIKKLPGYPRDLPFKLETGYVGIGKNEEVQLFYYFVESTTNPEEDPLIFYVPGGPGASALITFLDEI
ncbi:hypothetical protein Ccrd_017484, partial [Cynara cardunculus var. scolymus]